LLTKINFFFLFIFLSAFFCAGKISAQPDLEKLGVEDKFGNTGYAYFNFGDANKVNIEVSVLGYVKNPGRYLIPEGTDFLTLLTFSGGPLVDAEMNDVRLVRLKNDTIGILQDQIIKINYNNLFWEENVSTRDLSVNPVLMPGDIIILPGEPRLFFKDKFSIILSISTTLISLAILMINILDRTN
jgi:hypothetical protein